MYTYFLTMKIKCSGAISNNLHSHVNVIMFSECLNNFFCVCFYLFAFIIFRYCIGNVFIFILQSSYNSNLTRLYHLYGCSIAHMSFYLLFWKRFPTVNPTIIRENYESSCIFGKVTPKLFH